MATFFDSRVSSFFITTASGGSVEISDYVTGLEGIPGTRRLNPVTTFGAVGDRFSPGLQSAEFTLNLLYSEDAVPGTDYVFGPLRENSTAVAFSFYPTVTTGKLYSGNLWIENYNILSKIGSRIEAVVTGKVDNGVTRT